MRIPATIGHIFYGIAIAGIGLLTVYYKDFPYMLIPIEHSWIPSLAMVACIFGGALMLAGLFIIFRKKTGPVSLLLGSVLLLIFCFYFIPYQLKVSSNYRLFWDWENAAKELALASGALVIAGSFSQENKNSLTRLFAKLLSFGTILFSLTIVSFGIDHFLLAKEASDYVPSWVPYHLFWMYFCGAALLGSGLAIILKIKTRLVASLLAAMIFTWFIILHMPRIIASPAEYRGSEIASALIALAYSGIALLIASTAKKQQVRQIQG